MEELQYFLLPVPAWNMLTSWYGLTSNSRPIARKVIEHGMYMKYCKVEVYLLEFKLSLYPNLNISKTRSFSRADTVGDLEAALREEFQVRSDHECRVWHHFVTTTFELLSNSSETYYEMLSNSSQTYELLSNTNYELLSNSSQTLQDAGLHNGQVKSS